MTKEIEITPENIREVLLNSGFEPMKDHDCYAKGNIKVQIKSDGYNIEYDVGRSTLNIASFVKFLYHLHHYTTILPLQEESILEWWEKNKIEGFELEATVNNRGDFYFNLMKDSRHPLLGLSHVYVSIAKIYAYFDWSDARIKSTIVELCRLYKD